MNQSSQRDVKEFKVIMKPKILSIVFGSHVPTDNDEVLSTHLTVPQKMKWISLGISNADVVSIG
jgi:hypothetical protein